MAHTLASSVTLSINANYQDALDLSTPQDALKINFRDSMASGAVKDQNNVLWHDSRALTAESEDLALGSTLVDGFGTTVTFTKVKGIYIKNTSTTAGDILAVGGAAGTQFVAWVANASDIINIGPDGVFLLYNPSLAGYAVGDGTADDLKIDSGVNNITYEIAIWGVGTHT